MICSVLNYTKASLGSLFADVEGFPFFLDFFSSDDLENKKSPAVLDSFFPADAVFLIYPSISAPSSVLRFWENSISPLTTPVLPITTFCADIFPSRCP